MDRNQIAAICKEVIYECVPDKEGPPEARFDVKIPQRQWARMSTFGDVVNAFEKRINRKF